MEIFFLMCVNNNQCWHHQLPSSLISGKLWMNNHSFWLVLGICFVWFLHWPVARKTIPDSKVHGANMGPTWALSAPDGSHVGPTNLVIRDYTIPKIPARFCVGIRITSALLMTRSGMELFAKNLFKSCILTLRRWVQGSPFRLNCCSHPKKVPLSTPLVLYFKLSTFTKFKSINKTTKCIYI